MLISVVVPVKDDADGLRSTLASIPDENQVEIIVIDGGSKECTLEVIREHIARIGYFESGEDSGIANAMNRGIERSTGDYVAILNAGDEWLPKTFERVLAAIAQKPDVGMFHGSIRYQHENGTTYERKPHLARMHRRMWMFHPTWFVSANCYATIGGYDERYELAMDSEWCHRAITSGVKIVEIDACMAVMTLGGRSDIHFTQALGEYRRSVVKHGLSFPVTAWFWYRVFVLVKTLRRSISRFI